MKLNKFAKLGAVAVLSAVFLAACGSKSSSSSSKQVLNWDQTAELPTMDLSKATDRVSFDTLNNTNEGLYRLGKDSKVEPGMATKTVVSNDGLKYTFTLRKNAKWSNGDKVTAKDFVYSWQRTVKPSTGSQYAYLFSGIQNADDITAGKKAPSTLGVKADGDYKLVVTLDKQIPYFKLLMGFASFFPQNQKTVEKYGSKYGTASKYMVYNGPFKLTKWTGSNLSWTMKKNNDYWDKKNVKLSAINNKVNKSNSTGYNLYQSDKLDMTYLNAEQAKRLADSKELVTRRGASTFYLEYNQTKKEFQNKKIRQALSLVINRKQFTDKVLGDGSTVAKGLVASDMSKHNGKDFADEAEVKEATATDTAKAKKLWNEGLKELGVKELSFALLSDDTDKAKDSTEFIQSQIEENLSGAKVSVTNVPFKTRLDRSVKGNFDVVITAWGADFADPISFLDLFTADNTYNNGKWKNAEYDKLIESSKTTNAGDTSKRWDDLVQAQKVLLKDQGIAPIYQQAEATMVKSKVKGVIYNSAGANYNFKDAYIK
ncbi:oligopeptide ABC transporter [Liquorilactobacillus sucicola DSM 21376 = JCM 15457]|uniref:Oligopeptide-binding protein n=1 Tax=Liquorilactobacillus sucicola DSM 21376 = JCM 15457 TaxID=1423806 RepID=A0A023CYC9_9LACO|nr:peptide ABC transporter substrate-binding protein [Liquorilactobacillus sucicola]KRN07565.1 oligopeptide-binding protein [Liquorilactobacillus sucicola DSM 21376 = JCM 15457]GAJ26804.1 oligopeptide ABC transporter [Liquorilactobacillus sucicola DSM 21376 = JCM 15457]